MQLTPAQLETLRTRPHSSKLDLFIFQPRVVMKCRLDSTTAAKNDRTIPFDTVSFGSYLDVSEGMTLLVGRTEGGSELGRVRISEVTSAYFTVSENSNIKWEDELYLTVLRYWDLWPIFPRIIQDPSDEANVIFYKDYDIPYGSQNYYLGTFANAGPHRAVFLENGTGSVYYSATGTLNLLGSNLSYDWEFEGGTPTGSTAYTPGTVNYTSAGNYVTRLSVTDLQNGNTDTTYRYVAVRDKIGEGGNTPVVRWEVSNLNGARDNGGYSAQFKVYDTLDIDENCLIILKSNDWFGTSNFPLGGNYPNTSDVFFVGYIESGSIRYNAFYNYLEFEAISITGMMKKMTGFSVSVESKQNPATWFELRDMDIRRAVYHYLKWHSTVLSVTDFTFVGEDRPIQFFDVDRTSLFDAVDNLMKSALFGRLSSDRQGRLYAEVDPLAYDNPTGSFVPVMNITRRDWMSEPSITERVYDDNSYVELGGIAYSGPVTGTFEALLSGAPGYSPSFHGNVEKISGLALEGQSQLNQLSGNLWANRNQAYPTINMNMAIPTRNLDIAPQEVVGIKIERSDTIRDREIDGLYIPTSISWSYNSERQTLLPTIEFTGVVSGDPGDTILIPPSVEDADFEFPEFSFPAFPPFKLPGLEIISPLSIKHVVIHVKDKGIYYTNNFNDPSPSWQSANTNLGLFPSIMRNFEVVLNGNMLVQLGNDSVWSTSKPGGTWKKIFDATYVQNYEGYPFPREYITAGFGVNRKTGATIILGSLIITIFATNAVYSWIGNVNGVSNATQLNIIPAFDSSASQRYFYITSNNNSSWLLTYNNGANQISSLVLSGNGVTAGLQVDPIPSSTNTQSVAHMTSNESSIVHVAKATNGVLSLDGGGSWNRITGTPTPYSEPFYVDRFETIATNADGTQIVIGASTASMGLCFSVDTGASWYTGAFGSTNARAVWHLGESAYVYGANSNVYLVEDITLSTGAYLKTGNLANLITGTFEIIAIRHY